jgi:hypothetical protein
MLLKGAQVAPRLLEPEAPRREQKPGEDDGADRRGRLLGQEHGRSAEGGEGEPARHRGAEQQPARPLGQHLRREEQEQRDEHGQSRDRQRHGGAVEFEERDGEPRRSDVEEERPDGEERQPPVSARDEEHREGDRDADRGGHPRPEQHDQAADLRARVSLVGRPERRVDDPVADEREDAGGGGDRGEGDERHADDVPRRAGRRERRARERHARHHPERGRGHRHERRGDEVRVGEARDRARAEPAREPEAHDEEGLQRDRHECGARELGQPRSDLERDPGASLGAKRQRDERHGECDRPVQERPPRAGDDAVLVHAPEDEREAEDAPERVAGGGGRVAVVGSEGARRERGAEVRDGGGDEEDERVRGRLATARG